MSSDVYNVGACRHADCWVLFLVLSTRGLGHFASEEWRPFFLLQLLLNQFRNVLQCVVLFVDPTVLFNIAESH